MRSERDPRPFLQDIFDCIQHIPLYTGNTGADEFLRNSMMQDAVVRRLEIIGEAASHLPVDLRQRYPEVYPGRT
jgi:uncharacterized protein with HEPN domain